MPNKPTWLRWRAFRNRRAILDFERSWMRSSSGRSLQTIETPIAIVGGGPSGLLLSNLLSSYQVPSVLIEGQSVEERCKHPQAHFLNTRSMEILRQLPRVHRRVQDQMTPVEQWKHFQFGYNMLPETSLARVHHPVDRPLLANVDANGTLVGESRSEEGPIGSSHRPLSACSVGHLAQHTFCKILHRAAQEGALPDTKLQYSARVTQMEDTHNVGFSIHTDANLTVRAPVCVAADGAHSFCRDQWKIGLVGQPGIQHLLNIHVKTCPEWARSYLHDRGRNFAMLYSTFHPNVLAMVVAHSIGEYVFQVPFFPPFQTLDDYSPDRVYQMVLDAMGIDNDDIINKQKAQLDIVSVKAWTMSSLIADRYFHPTPNGNMGFLVGDAAHVFPPAGGLGMNTGMQDVYSLAWKLAWAFHLGYLSPERAFGGSSQSILKSIGTEYEHERRPVAQSNAALSVRNYNRILNITKACYLNEQHPAFLIEALQASSALVPFQVQRRLFQRLYAAATWPLSSLRDPQHPYTRHLRQNIRRILAKGGGLPLLFPQAELGFGYGDTPCIGCRHDTMGFTPDVGAGYLFPHVEAAVSSPKGSALLDTFPGLKPLDSRTASEGRLLVSTSDLASQVSRDGKPCFVLLCVSDTGVVSFSEAIGAVYLEAAQIASKTLGFSVEVVHMLPSSSSFSPTIEWQSSQHLVLKEMAHPVDGSYFEKYKDSVWLIRPDGHVAGRVASGSSTVTKKTAQLHHTVIGLAHQALFGSSGENPDLQK